MAREGHKQRSENARDDWETPPWLVELLNREFDFDVDAAAHQGNHLFDNWYGPGSNVGREDALAMPWLPRSRHFCNAPFSSVAEFVEQICAQDVTAALVTALAPERRWYQAARDVAQDCRQLTRRVQYLINGERPVSPKTGKPTGNTIGSTIFVFRRGAPRIPGGAPIWMWDAHGDAEKLGLLTP